jgi:tetratricopeptide (TPR) repeat protein
MALAGNSAETSKLVGHMIERYPNDTLVKYNYVPTVRAALALTSKQPQMAIELLRETTPYELGQPLHSIYIRGQSLLAMGHSVEITVEFLKILDQPGLIVNDPLYDLALLQLGRSYALAGDRKKACATYEAVLRLWSNADREFAITQQARREYARIAPSI